MNDNGNLVPSSNLTPELEQTAPVAAKPKPSRLRWIFVGPNGLRAGWRLALYVLFVFLLMTVERFIRHHWFPSPARDAAALFDPVHDIFSRGLGFVIAAVAALIMTLIEREKWRHYGLPLRRALSRDFWFGIAWGFVGLSVVMFCLWAAGFYRIEGLALHGTEIWKFAALWGVAFLFVALLEEFLLRGYTQYTLASGIGFWPAAVILSSVFLWGHTGNSGESWIGLADVFLFGLFACLTLRRTGDLWFAVGAHAAWDWGETFFYSVPDSGMLGTGHLFHMSMRGPAWLSGGSAGPEGSAINILFDLTWFVIFALIYRKRKWVGMNERRLAAKPVQQQSVAIDTSALTGSEQRSS